MHRGNVKTWSSQTMDALFVVPGVLSARASVPRVPRCAQCRYNPFRTYPHLHLNLVHVTRYVTTINGLTKTTVL